MDCFILLCFVVSQKKCMAISTARLEYVIIEKGNLLVYISVILKTMTFTKCVLLMRVCMYLCVLQLQNFYCHSKKK